MVLSVLFRCQMKRNHALLVHVWSIAFLLRHGDNVANRVAKGKDVLLLKLTLVWDDNFFSRWYSFIPYNIIAFIISFITLSYSHMTFLRFVKKVVDIDYNMLVEL